MAKPGYRFANWTDNGSTVSAYSTYQLLVSLNRSLRHGWLENLASLRIAVSPECVRRFPLMPAQRLEFKIPELQIGQLCAELLHGAAILLEKRRNLRKCIGFLVRQQLYRVQFSCFEG